MFWSFYWQNSIFHFFGMFAVKHSIAISPFKSQITTQKEEQIEKKKECEQKSEHREQTFRQHEINYHFHEMNYRPGKRWKIQKRTDFMLNALWQKFLIKLQEQT